MAAFAAINAITITRGRTAPVLQCGVPQAQQNGHLTGSCAASHRCLKNFQGFAAICRCGQSPSSSPQFAWIFFEAISSAAASAKALSLRRSSCGNRLISR